MTTLSYGPLPEQVADVRLPAATGRPAPLVVVVHGGFWRDEWDRAHAGPQSDGLAAAGYVVATVEYRRVGWRRRLAGDPGRRRAAGRHRARPGRRRGAGTGSTGPGPCSSGTRPAGTWRPGRPPGTGCRRPRRGTGRRRCRSAWCRWPACSTSGSRSGSASAATRPAPCWADHPPSSRDRYAAADPARLLPTGVPTVLVHGTLDEDVPVDVSRAVPRRGRCRRRRRRPARARRRRPHGPRRPHLPRLANRPRPPSPTHAPRRQRTVHAPPSPVIMQFWGSWSWCSGGAGEVPVAVGLGGAGRRG